MTVVALIDRCVAMVVTTAPPGTRCQCGLLDDPPECRLDTGSDWQ